MKQHLAFSLNGCTGRLYRVSPSVTRCVLSQGEPQPGFSAIGLCRSVRSAAEEEEPVLHAAIGDDGRVRWEDGRTGRTLLTLEACSLRPIQILKTTGSDPASTRTVKTVDGERVMAGRLQTVVDRTAWEGELCFSLPEGTALHGLGQGEDGVYDYRGHRQYLYQHNMRIPIPFLVTDQGFGILFDCGSTMVFESRDNRVRMRLDAVEQADFYVIAGDSLDALIGGFRALTGDAKLLPKWAYGYWQSKEAYASQEELVEVAAEYRRRGVPLDCVVQDWNSWEPGLWGNKHLDKTRYPNMRDAMDRLHAMHVRGVISIWPNLGEGSADHRELKEAGCLLADNSTYNAMDENARRLYWDQLSRELVPDGFDGWWCDSTEPFTGPDWCGEQKRPEQERYELVAGEHKKFLDAAQANLFALRHAQGIYENQRASGSPARVVNLTRSGYAGSQKYNAILWSGDISASWDTLRRQITEGLNLCMSGLPYWTLDAGAFFTVKDDYTRRGCGSSGNPNPLWFWAGEYNRGCEDPGYRELYTRWLQYAVFLPVFRSHGTDTPREIWRFGEKGSMFYDAIEKAIRLRYRLMPTVYSLAAGVALRRETILRSLLFDFPGDKTAASLSDEFLFGRSLLVCPVTEPMYDLAEGRPIARAAVRRCWLPAGVRWYDLETDALLDGGQFVDADAPIDRIPVFVRAGSILPMEQGLLYASQETGAPFEIHVYPGQDADFLLYEDDGDGWDWETGSCNQIALHWDDSACVLTVGPAAFSFPQGIRGRELLVVRHGEHSASRLLRYEGESLRIGLS